MKSTYRLLSLLLVPLFLLASCKELHEVTMDEVHDFEDAVTGVVPTGFTWQTKVVERTDLSLIVAVSTFYDASEADKQAVAVRVGQLGLEKLGGDIRKGTLVLTKLANYNRDKDPEDALYIDMRIDSLREVIAKSQEAK